MDGTVLSSSWIYNAPIEVIENRIIRLKREKEGYDAEQEEEIRILEEERKILEMQMEMKKKEKKVKKMKRR